MAGKVVEIVEEHINPIIENLGYEVVEVEFAKKVDGMNLCFYIDSPNGITIDDCEKVHKLIDAPLDELNPTGDMPYILSVSSCGLDRPIKTDKDLKRNLNKVVDVKLYAPLNKKKAFTGILKDFNEENIVITENELDINLPRKMIGNISLHLEF
ncbi:MAG: ribosome maturation factor RimP [Firmicutes bacterium]|nr:ribosome maturation factor RimP [Bacillota bacterium]